MTILVTGGGGYIGSHTTWRLVDAGESVVVLDDLSTGFNWAIPGRAEFVRGDVGDSALLAKIFSDHAIDSVIHFAGSIIVPESVSDPLAYYNNNTVKSRSLIQAAVSAGVEAFLFSSTAAVYGQPGHEPVDETHPLAPISPYGRSKLMTEWMLEDVGRAHGLAWTALRYFNVAGADPQGRTGQSSPQATHLIKVAVQAALGIRHHLEIYGTDFPTPDGSCVRDYIHVSDLADAHARALHALRNKAPGGIFNCGYGRGFSVMEVVDRVKAVSGVDFPVSQTSRRPGDPPSIIARADKLASVLRWRPKYDNLDQIITHALTWEQRLQTRNSARRD